MSAAKQVTRPCGRCGSDVISLVASVLGRDVTIPGQCAVCQRAAKQAERDGVDRLRTERRLRACGCEDPDVWSDFQGVVDRAVSIEIDKGVIWVQGGAFSGKTTLAKAWVRGRIRSGRSAAYINVPALLLASRKEFADSMSLIASVDEIAMDDIGQNNQPLPVWDSDRISAVLSRIGGRVGLITSPWRPTDSEFSKRVGDDISTRCKLLFRRPIVLPAPEVA